MKEVITKNRSGWILHEYINIPEEEIPKYPKVTGSYVWYICQKKYGR